MAPRRTAKKATGKKRTSKKSTTPVRPAASSNKSELDELKAMKGELTKGFEELNQGLKDLNKAREDFQREQALAKLNQDLAAGGTLPVVKQETEEQRVSRQREEARAERRKKREEDKAQARAAPTNGAKPKPAPEAAPAGDKGPVKIPMNELQKYKLEVLNRNYADAVNKIKEAVRDKYVQQMAIEVQALVSRDPACVKAQTEQIIFINEISAEVGPSLPEGYAITQMLTEASLIVAQYVPERAGKPLALPSAVPSPEEG